MAEVRASAANASMVASRPTAGGPLPDIAAHLVKAVAIRRVGADWRRAQETVLQRNAMRKLALPDVAGPGIARTDLVAPGVKGSFKAAAGGSFPLQLRRQACARPLRKCYCIAERDMYDRVLWTFISVGTRAFWGAPTGPLDGLPPSRER